ncbi:MAG: hypothetical protein PVI26_09235, partial [Chitinispirillia bacterium]
VRHYGLLHHTNKKLFLLTKKKLENTGNHSEIRDETGDDTKQSKPRFIQCPHCKKGELIIIGILNKKTRGPP